jgi:signal recognition particle receptor subunit beta
VAASGGDEVGPGAGRGLATRVQEVANAAHRLCLEAERTDWADALRREGDRYRKVETTVVVIGEENRGKSTLVNALVGEDVVPVDADVTTGTYIALTHGDLRAAYVYRGDEDALAIPIDDLAAWATVDGAHVGDEPVRGIVVTLDAPILRPGVHIVDTPGVGGLDGALAAVTLGALPTADVVVVVLDGGTPLSAPELRFLERATTRVACVLFAVGRIDLHPGWREIADADRALLATHAPRFESAPIVGVSGYLAAYAARAMRAGQVELASEARSRSGVDELAATIEGLAARGRTVKLANLVRLVDAVLDELESAESVRLASANDDQGAHARLEDQQRRLEEVSDSSARWRIDLDYEVKRLGYEFETRVDGAISALERRYIEQVGRRGKDVAGAVRADLERALPALWSELNDFLRDWFASTLDALLAQVAIDLPELTLRGLQGSDTVVGARAGSPDENTDVAGAVLQYYPVIFAASMPTTVASMASALMGGGAVTMNPFLVIAGLGMAGTVLVARRTQTHGARDRRQATELVRTTLIEARRQILKQFGQEMTTARRLLEDEVGGRLQERRRLLERQLKEDRELARQDATERARARQVAERRLGDIAAVRASTARLRDEMAVMSG